MLWVLGFNVTPDKLTPLWPGWNTNISETFQYTQKIWYLPQINQSPTNHSIVTETMRRSLVIVAEARKIACCNV